MAEKHWLTSDEIIQINLDVVLGRPATNLSPEATEFREKVAADIDDMKARGVIIEVPYELCVPD